MLLIVRHVLRFVVTAARFVALCAIVTASAAIAATAAPTTRSEIAWQPCPAGSVAAEAGGFTCATVSVPLDYADPHGATIHLALVKHAASDPTHRIGTLFANPGGPGGQGLTQIPGWIDFFPQALKTRFDIVSWDPRGVGFSTAVQCFDSPDAEGEFLGDNGDFPRTVAQQPAYIKTWAEFGKRCAARNGMLLAHVSTGDSARDLDRLRQLVGEPKLRYIGLSYGTILGATYANLFPDRVRALVLDGNIAPSNWRATPPSDPSHSISMRIGTDALTAKALDIFLTMCGNAGTNRCAFSAGTAAATHAKFLALSARLQTGPVYLGARAFSYSDFLAQIPEGLLLAFPHPNERVPSQAVQGWVGLAKGLETVWEARAAAPPTPDAAASSTPAASATPATEASASAPAVVSYVGPEQALSIECGDVPVPPSSAFPALAMSVEKREGPVGVSIVWGDAVCATWPVQKAPGIYTGPFNRKTAAPILVVGNTTDPSTPYENSVGMAKELADARLLTVYGYGHTAILNPSACANAAISAYLIDGTLPPKGKVCRQDASPF
jgi:pimeloyl-ACP methyl ester carboxylesterase